MALEITAEQIMDGDEKRLNKGKELVEEVEVESSDSEEEIDTKSIEEQSRLLAHYVEAADKTVST